MFPEPAPAPTPRTGARAVEVTAAVVLFGGLALARALVLAAHREPVGIDLGNWVSVGASLVGQGFAGVTPPTPPVVPLVALAVERAAGLGPASWVLGGVSGALVGAGVWWALRAFTTWWCALWAGVVAALAPATSAAAAWGGYPQLLGLAALPVAVAAGARLATSDTPGRRAALVLGGWTAAIAATSHLALAWAAVAVPAALVLAGSRRHSWAWVRTLPWALVVLVPFVPLYVRLALELRPVGERGRSGAATTVVDVVLGGGWWWWLVLALVGLVTVVARRRTGDVAGWALAASMLVTAMVAAVARLDQRVAYVIPVAVAVAAGWGLGEWWIDGRHRRAVPAVAAALLVAIGLPALGAQRTQQDFYARFSPPGTSAAIGDLRRLSDPGDLVASAPVDGAPAGWLVQGGSRRDTLVGSSPEWLFMADERARAEEAIAIFTDEAWPSERSFALAREAGVDWLYVPATWGGVDPAALAAATERHPGLVAADRTGNLVLRVPPAGA